MSRIRIDDLDENFEIDKKDLKNVHGGLSSRGITGASSVVMENIAGQTTSVKGAADALKDANAALAAASDVLSELQAESAENKRDDESAQKPS